MSHFSKFLCATFLLIFAFGINFVKAEDINAAKKSAPPKNLLTWSQKLNLDGKNDYYQIPKTQSLNLQNQFTASLWIKSNENRLNETTKQREILTRRGSNISFGYEYETVEHKIWLRCYLKYEDGSSQEVEWRDMADQITRDNHWHHFLVTYKKNEYFRLFIDGKMVDEEKAPDKKVNLSDVNNDYIIGARMKFNGAIDRNLMAEINDVMIFNRSLTKDEAKNLYKNSLSDYLSQ